MVDVPIMFVYTTRKQTFPTWRPMIMDSVIKAEDTRKVPAFTLLHMTIYGRLKKYGPEAKMPEHADESKVRKCLQDLVGWGWIRVS